jgi:hypothetical protein
MIVHAGTGINGGGFKLPGGHTGRLALAGLVTALLAIPAPAAQAQHVTPAPEPAALTAVSTETLESRYQANRENIAAAERMADQHGDRTRTETLRVMSEPERQFLTFDGRGDGRAVEVLGDLAAADRVAVLVPGSGTTLDTFEKDGTSPHTSLARGARALYDEMGQTDPSLAVAVVAWLGYDTPDLVSLDVLTTGLAEDGSDELTALLRDLQRTNPRAEIALFGHSYGSVVVGMAAADGVDVADIAVYGSPGLGVSSADELGVDVRVWAARGWRDWTAGVPSVTVDLSGVTFGFGTDPTDEDFGARTFATGSVGHGDYLEPGSTSLSNLALIALGRGTEVSAH